MKKKYFIVVLFLGFAQFLNAQETALEKMGKELCEDFSKNIDELNKLSRNEKTAKLGLKMLSLYGKYQKDLKKEGIEIDLKDQNSAENLGEQIGLEMAKYCPNVMLSLFGDMIEEEVDAELAVLSVAGKIKKIEGEDLNVLIIKDGSGKMQKFIWLDNFEGSDILIEKLDDFKNEQVEVFYENFEIFSPKLKEYIVKKKISRIKFLE